MDNRRRPADLPAIPSDEECRAEIAAKIKAGEFSVAITIAQRRLMADALQWLKEEGLEFAPADPTADDPTGLLVGLAVAAQRELDKRGAKASVKLHVAVTVLHGIAGLRYALSKPIGEHDKMDRIAEMVFAAASFGAADMETQLLKLGWFEEIGKFRWEKLRRGLGALSTNRKKATIRETALSEALRISDSNPTLSNEDLARKIATSLSLSTTIRTMTSWVREWRKAGILSPLKK